MSIILKKLMPVAMTALLALSVGIASAEVIESSQASGEGKRATVIEANATVVKIDHKSREVTLQAPDGRQFTLSAPESLGPLNDIHAGDTMRAAYVEAIAGEVREPSEAELAMPWMELSQAELGKIQGQPVAADAVGVRAVCTIEGMNRLLGTATVTDANGRVHIITQVEPSMMEGVTLGQTVVIDYIQALAISLERISLE